MVMGSVPTPMCLPMLVQPGTRSPTWVARLGLWHRALWSQSVGAAGLMTGSPVRGGAVIMVVGQVRATWAMVGSGARGVRPALVRAVLRRVRSWVSVGSVVGEAE